MIVVGCRGRGALQQRLLGSVSAGLVHHAYCPVAVIHNGDPSMPHPAKASVLVGIDGSPASELATGIAFDQASRRGVELVALHAWSDTGVYEFPGTDWSTFKSLEDQLLAERAQQQMAVGDLAQLQAKLASAREELAALDHKREQAKAQVAAVQQDRTELTKWLDGKRTKRSEKDSARATKPARIAARTQPET